ncbi:hypothetical protein KQI38_07595 [Tissierella carlieri]|uniref:hypothetical protein n=1 Tax=Tissierella carlieri TaxID=689904 RepID=UPI001C0FAF30|nr:hypothetical protein [Tissierella carlieri]MBU5311890.1 hypothetical protein [Tissierella carlieri]
MNIDRCIVTDDDILTLLKTENIDSWERLLERTGYTNMEYLKRRVRRMQDKGLIIIGKDKSCLNILFKDRESKIAWNKRRKAILAEARSTLKAIGR